MPQKVRFALNSFFSGIGGFEIAFEKVGIKTLLQCEVNKFCQEVLKHHFKNVKLEADINNLNISEIPKADIWCGGFPCQDVSVARGSKGREGLKGKNSGLFYPFAKLIEAKKPKILLIENVTGLLSSHNGQDFRIILETLSGFGYSIAWRVMNSRYFGIPQSRPRVFICAVLNNSKFALSSLYETKKGTKPKNQRDGFLTINECEISGAIVPDTAYCLAATSGRHTGTDWSRTYVSYHNSVRRLIPKECEGLQGFPIGWTDVNFNSSEIDSERYHALGNAVAVPVVEWIAKRVKANLTKEEQVNRTPLKELFETHEDFQDKSLRKLKLSELHLSTETNGKNLKWQSGGLVIGDNCWDITAPEAPSKPINSNLIDIISKESVSTRYFISPNAAEGILRRVNSQNRTLFEPMSKALQRLVASTL
jgi:DNA (cytosine-5)-methyltransferase 1